MTTPLRIPAFADLGVEQFSQLTAAARTVPVRKKSKAATGVADLEREVRALGTRADEIATQIRSLHAEARILVSQRAALMNKRHKLQREIANIKAKNKHGQ